MRLFRLALIALGVTTAAAACNSGGITGPESEDRHEHVMGSGGG